MRVVTAGDFGVNSGWRALLQTNDQKKCMVNWGSMSRKSVCVKDELRSLTSLFFLKKRFPKIICVKQNDEVLLSI